MIDRIFAPRGGSTYNVGSSKIFVIRGGSGLDFATPVSNVNRQPAVARPVHVRDVQQRRAPGFTTDPTRGVGGGLRTAPNRAAGNADGLVRQFQMP